MILSKKIRLKPSSEQESKLWQSVGTARFIYNWTLNRQEENYKIGGKFISNNDLRKEITQLKKTDEYAWLSEVSNNVSKQAVKDACDAYKRFFNGTSKKPRFKSRRRSKTSFYNDTGKLKVKKKSVLIEKVGWMKTSEQVPQDTKYTNPRVSYDGKYWYLSVGIETLLPEIKLTDEIIGIDLGVKDLAICSNGLIFKNINKSKTIRKEKKKLKKMQKQVSRKYVNNREYTGKGGECRYQYKKTENIKKLEKKIRIKHRRLTNIRKNHVHQSTTTIVKTKPCRIVIEDLSIKNMMKNKHLSKAIAEQSLYEFRKQIEYKSEFYGIEVVIADKWFPSSKLCSKCSNKKKDLKLSDRVYNCICGHSIDRDLNASINLSRYEN